MKGSGRKRQGKGKQRAQQRKAEMRRAEREFARLLEAGLPEPEVNGHDLLAEPEETET